MLQAAAGKVAREVEPAADKLSAVVEDKAHQLRVTMEEQGDQLGEAAKEQVSLPEHGSAWAFHACAYICISLKEGSNAGVAAECKGFTDRGHPLDFASRASLNGNVGHQVGSSWLHGVAFHGVVFMGIRAAQAKRVAEHVEPLADLTLEAAQQQAKAVALGTQAAADKISEDIKAKKPSSCPSVLLCV